MGVFCQYGNYTHALNEVASTFERKAVRAKDGSEIYSIETWNITGFLQAPDQLSVAQAVAIMESAYAIPYQNIRLINPDTGVVLRFLPGSQRFGGVKVEARIFPESGFNSAEFTTFRRYNLVVTGTVDPGRGPFTLVDWHEEMTLWGGLPRIAFRVPMTGLPVKQVTSDTTPYFATQKGSSVGLFTWIVAPPTFPGDLKTSPVVSRSNPRKVESLGAPYNVEYPATWSYEFESAATPLVGLPNFWPY